MKTNKEHYRYFFLENIGEKITVKNNKPVICNNDCENCGITHLMCINNLKEWLDEPYQQERYSRYIPYENDYYHDPGHQLVFKNSRMDIPSIISNRPEHELLFKYIKRAFRTKEECREYIEFWKRVDERRKPFTRGTGNCFLYINGNSVYVGANIVDQYSKYYFGNLSGKQRDELIEYLGKENIKKFMFEVE